MSPTHPYSGIDNLEAMKAAHNYNGFLAALIRRNAPRHGTILDFGAGAGDFARTLTQPMQHVVCVEPDPQLREALQAEGFEAFASIAELDGGSADFIYSLNVLEHIEDDVTAAKELFRVLKPGGTCLVYVPALQVLYSSMDKKVGHIRRYDRRGLCTVLRQAGFRVETVKYADSLGFFATLAFKWFGNDDGSLNPRGLALYDRFAFPVSRLLDAFTQRLFGKNVFAVARKPSGA